MMPGAVLNLNDVIMYCFCTVNPIQLEIGLRPNSAGIPYTLLLRIEAIGFPTFRLLRYTIIYQSIL